VEYRVQGKTKNERNEARGTKTEAKRPKTKDGNAHTFKVKISPNTVEQRAASELKDHRKKSCIPIQHIVTVFDALEMMHR